MNYSSDIHLALARARHEDMIREARRAQLARLVPKVERESLVSRVARLVKRVERRPAVPAAG